jgi:hypothetical protein
MINQQKHYTYIIRDPRPDQGNVPVYVGKGKGARAWHHSGSPRTDHVQGFFLGSSEPCFCLVEGGGLRSKGVPTPTRGV